MARAAVTAELQANRRELTASRTSLEEAAAIVAASVRAMGQGAEPALSLDLALPSFSTGAWQTTQMTDAGGAGPRVSFSRLAAQLDVLLDVPRELAAAYDALLGPGGA